MNRFTKVFVLSGLVFGWCGGVLADAERDERIRSVESSLVPLVRTRAKNTDSTKLADRMAMHKVPGVSIAVIDRFQLDWAKGYGTADVETKTPVTAETLFQAASISKPVTALAVLSLARRGLIQLDADVNQQLRSWKLPDNEWTAKTRVTPRMLLSHTAGLSVHGFPGYLPKKPLPTVVQILDGVAPANTQAVRVVQLPGSGFKYSGGGTTILQLLVTDVAHKPFADFMRETVLDPLAMEHSTYEQPLPAALIPYATTGHNDELRSIPGKRRVHPEQAAAGLWTTPSDLAQCILEVQLAYVGRPSRILDQAWATEMVTKIPNGPVGLGPFLQGRADGLRFEHGGSNIGFRCQFVGYLQGGKGAVVMTNSELGDRIIPEILAAIATVYDWPDYPGKRR